MGVGVEQQPGRVGQVADLDRQPGRAGHRDRVVEDRDLGLGGRVVGVVGAGEVRPDGHGVEVVGGGSGGDDGVPVGAGGAAPGETRVDLEMHPRASTDPRGGCVDLGELGDGVGGHVDVE